MSDAQEEKKEGIVVNPFHHNDGAEKRDTEETAKVSAQQAQASAASAQQTTQIVGGTLTSGSVVDTKQTAIVSSPNEGVTQPSTAASTNSPAASLTGFVQTGITDVDKTVEGLLKNVSLQTRLLIDNIKQYVVAMKPGKIMTVKDGVRQQVSLYTSIINVINNVEGEDFRPAMQSILALLHAHRNDAFRESHVFRFIEHVPLSSEHRRGFQKIVTLLKTLSNPATRQDLLRQIHFDNVTQYGLTERGRTKLSAFFGK